jgi:hypothetical protein
MEQAILSERIDYWYRILLPAYWIVVLLYVAAEVTAFIAKIGNYPSKRQQPITNHKRKAW